MASKSLPNKILKDAVNELTSLLKNTKAFVLKEAPYVLREILVYNRVIYSLQFLIGAVLVVVGFILWHNLTGIPNIDTSYSTDKWSDLKQFLCFLAGLSWIAGAIISTAVIPSLIKVFFAPKVFLIEYIRENMM